MFGYIVPDKPNMYMKDYSLYRAFYCSICKYTGKKFGQLMRFNTNYDITFIAILLHNILDEKVELNSEICVLNPLVKKSVVKPNRLIEKSVNLNLLLLDYKLSDDIIDTGRIRKKLIKFLIRRKVRKAARACPEIHQRIIQAIKEQIQVESAKTASVDKAAHPFASMMKDIIKILTADKYDDYIGNIIYQLARFIYISDAYDDFEKDISNGEFNPLVCCFQDAKTKEELQVKHREETEYMFKSAYNEIKRNYEFVNFSLSEGIITNILWYGLKESMNKTLNNRAHCAVKAANEI
ncbi:MAG: DUF5685 family protein [Christensenellales bacterium]|jgi:hypothetical protein